MWFQIPSDSRSLSAHVSRFMDRVGVARWSKHIHQLDNERRRSPFGEEIVSDYHWLEMAIGHPNESFPKGSVSPPEPVSSRALAAFQFAAAVVEVHSRLSMSGQRQLEGRLRDSLNAESGFAALYLELDLTLRLMAAGHDVSFPDLDGTGQFDLEFKGSGFTGEVECKSLAVDAGRRIHRKDFYRFMDSIAPDLDRHRTLQRHEVVLITLRDRLSRNHSHQTVLRLATANMLRGDAPLKTALPGFSIERRPLSDVVPAGSKSDPRVLHRAFQGAYGSNIHVAGETTDAGGCLIAMRSDREDDTSKPLLDAMRKAASQLSGRNPSFIAIQFQDIEAADLLEPSLRRRAAILSRALFEHYGAAHVNASYFCSFPALIQGENWGIPAIAALNPQPSFPVAPADASVFLAQMSDSEFGAATRGP